MTVRTTDATVSFAHAFRLTSLENAQPSGTYRLVIDEEEVPGLSFLAYRRTATMLHVPAPGGGLQVVQVDPAELDAAIAADSRA